MTACGDTPHGQTVFHEIAAKWDAVVVKDGRVQIPCFVEAVDDFLVVFRALGASFFFDMVKADMKRNLEKIETASRKYGVETLQEMVELEVRDHVYMQSDAGTEALLWLKRTLQFILHLLYYISTDDSTVPLNECARRAYEETMKPCHNWMLQRMFDAALLCIPTRSEFFKDLGTNEEVVRAGMRSFIEVAANQLNPIVAFYNQANLETLCSATLEVSPQRDCNPQAIVC